MDPFKNAQSADTNTKDIVIGYIHGMQSKLKLPDITELITYIILGFYNNPEFIASFLDEYFEISKDKLTTTQKRSIPVSQHAIYLNRWIESTSKSVVKWQFKINKIACSTAESYQVGMYFGIISEEKDPSVDFGGSTRSANYCVGSVGDRYIYNNDPIIIDGFRMNEGNSVTFILDLIDKKWIGQINDDQQCDLCDVETSIDIKYKFALAMRYAENSVSLIGFEVLYG